MKGKSFAEAVDLGELSLEMMRGKCDSELDRLMSNLEFLAESHGADPTMELKRAMMADASSMTTIAGLFEYRALGLAAQSLFGLIDELIAIERWNQESVLVHVRALRMILATRGADTAHDVVLDGLGKVAKRAIGPTSNGASPDAGADVTE